MSWHTTLTEGAEPLPTIAIGNEFIDTQPVEQGLIARDRRWTRGIGVDASGSLQFCAIPASDGILPPPDAQIIEHRAFHPTLSADLAAMPMVAALLIDYGYVESRIGDTLQAVRNHRHEHPLASPGEADVTAHVDFAALGRQGRSAGLAVDGPVTQAAFLGVLGAAERASRLMASNPASAAAIEAGIARLLSPGGMGGRFKVIGLRSPQVPPLPGLPQYT